MIEKLDSYYSIQFVANVTGINPHTIRAWEKRYSATTPERDKNGRRLYSDIEIERLKLLHKLVNSGSNISDIASKTNEELEDILSRYELKGNSGDKGKYISSKSLNELLNNMFMSIGFFKLEVLAHELQKASIDLGTREFSLGVIVPCLAEVRRLKGEGKLSGEEREQVYLIIKSCLIKKMTEQKNLPVKHKRILVASAKGQLNELGSLVVALLFMSRNINIDYLGGNVDPQVLGKLSCQFKPDYVFVGLSYSHDKILPHDEKQKYLTKLANSINPETKLMVGSVDSDLEFNEGNVEILTSFDAVDQVFRE